MADLDIYKTQVFRQQLGYGNKAAVLVIDFQAGVTREEAFGGCTTSECARASTVDASAYGLRPMLVPECVGDRAQGPREASLFDLGQKYADIIALADAHAYVGSLVPVCAATA